MWSTFQINMGNELCHKDPDDHQRRKIVFYVWHFVIAMLDSRKALRLCLVLGKFEGNGRERK